LQLEDRIWRAYGVLRHAQTITSNETLDLLSAVRLGVDVGIMTHVNRPTINDLLILSQPAHLQKLDGSKLSAQERDSKRAGLIRQRLNATEHDS